MVQAVPAAPPPLFTFAVVADIQYADKDDGHFEGRTQRFRQVPAKLAAAADAMLAEHARLRAAPAPAAAAGAPPGGGLAALLHLGDIIDGYGGEPDGAACAERDLALVEAQLARVSAAGPPLRHVLGNHCFGLPRAALLPRLGFPKGRGYYAAPLAAGWRLLVLDTTDVSLFGHDEADPEAAEAKAWLAAHPVSEHPNAQTWNGGASGAQLSWLRARLADAAAAGGRVVVAAHHPLAPGAAPAHYLSWSHRELRAAFEERPGVVALVLAGHYHPGGAAEVGGIHYVTLEGLLEAPPGGNAFAFVDVYGDRIAVRGQGAATSRELRLAAPPA
ncbi:MAG: Metallo-dependent phosphatase-like protein [Monoraphidium minutum]|nr:MAG: Metallo-dependent phosphatase-like protein [Monoraphidium minutum]